MNARFFTGYLPKDAATAWAPATAEHGPLPRLVFDIMLRDSRGVEFSDKCMVDDPALIREYEALLTAGRAVIVEGEQTARPFHKHGVLEGYVREVRVHRIEFPNRGGKKPADKPANHTADKPAEEAAAA
jgi:hypothetical protein